jgi:hypothetical protein
MVNGEHSPFDPAELGEVILAGGPAAPHARTLLMLNKHPDLKGAWERFVVCSIRIFGVDWKEHIWIRRYSMLARRDELRVLACETSGCMELAWARNCDQCLARTMGS